MQKNGCHKNCKKSNYHEYAKVQKAINTYLERVQNFNKIITMHSQVKMIKHSQGQLDIWLGSCAQNETKVP